jgi:RZ type zinc finger domain/AAA domain (dynein-related subfamily)
MSNRHQRGAKVYSRDTAAELAKTVDQSEAEYDPDNPESILGVRLAVLWSGGRWYQGVVDDFDSKNGHHHISYDDNDKRWHPMPEKTFRIVATDEVHYGVMSGDSAAPKKFEPYFAKEAGAQTTSIFSVMVPIGAVSPADGETVAIQGSLPELGAWEHSLPLHQSPDNPLVWSAEFVLPFSYLETCGKGVFEYKFCIEGKDGTTLETGFNRRPKSVQACYYSTFRYTSGMHRFQKLKKPKKREAMFMYARQEFRHMLDGHISPSQYLDRFTAIDDGYSGTTRVYAESIFDRFLADKLIPDNEEWQAIATMCLLGMVGTYGLSSSKKPSDSDEGIRVTAGGWANVGDKNKNKKNKNKNKNELPKPRDWCFYVLDNLAIRRVFAMDLKNVLGHTYYIRCVLGLQEVAERVRAHGSMRWLPLIPVLNQHKCMPKIRFTKRKVEQIELNAYLEAAAELTALADSLSAEAIVEQETIDENVATAIAEAKAEGKDEQKAVEKVNRTNYSRSLSNGWMRGLVLYAPTPEALFHPGFQRFASVLLPDVVEWARQYRWTNAEALQFFTKMVSNAAALHSPRLAAALLRNDSCDDGNIVNAMLDFVRMCVGELHAEAKGVDDDLDQIMHDLMSAAKEWIRRNHMNEPRYEEDEEKGGGGSGIGGFFGFGGRDDKKKKKRKRPSKEKLAQRRLDTLRSGVEAVNVLLQIKYFDMYPQGLLFELGRCHFFKGSPDLVLEAIASLGAVTKGFAPFSLHLGQWLVAQGNRILEEVVPALARNQGELLAMVHIINKKLPPLSDARHTFLSTLAGAAGDTSIASVLRNQPMWSELFRTSGTAEADWAADTPLNSLLRAVHQTIVESATAVNDSTVQLRLLHTIVNDRTAFLTLIHELHVGVLNEPTLISRSNDLHGFDQTLAEVNCYVNFFCNCGVKIDTEQLKTRIDQLTVEYDSLQLQQVRGSFTDLLAPYGNSISWLFRLRESELFLNMWRSVGKETARPSEDDIKALEAKRQADHKAAADEKKMSVAELDQLIESLLPQVQTDEQNQDASDEARGRKSTLRRLMRQKLEAAQELEDDEPLMQAMLMPMDMEDVVLDQKQMVFDLLPAVKREWRVLMEAVRDRTITIDRLQHTFAALNSDTECETELRVLALTGEGKVNEVAMQAEWVDTSFARMKDFLLLVRLSKWLPALLKIRELTTDLFATQAADDEYYSKLQTLLVMHREQWSSQTLDTVSSLVEPLRIQVVDTFTSTELDFLTLMSECEGLVQWLLEHDSTNEFNQLLQVVRPNTDEPRILSAIASLVQIRTLLLAPLYDKPKKEKFPGLRDFLVSIHEDVKINSDAYTHLSNVQACFDGLIDLFEKQARAPGIRSFYEVRDIAAHGEFVFRASGDPSAVLVLEMKVPIDRPGDDAAGGAAGGADASAADDGKTESGDAATAGGDGNGGGAAAANSAGPVATRLHTEPLEYLMDLRSKLMMTEIPEELEQEMKITALVESFVLQLEVLIEMRDELLGLYNAGHFDFQDSYTTRVRFVADGLVSLQDRLVKLRDETARWRKLVRTARHGHFYLNYFTMREILRLTAILCHKPAADESKNTPADSTDPLAVMSRESSDGWDDSKQGLQASSLAAATAEATRRIFESRDTDTAGGAATAAAAGESQQAAIVNPEADFQSLLHLVSSYVDPQAAKDAFAAWNSVANDDGADMSPEQSLHALGKVLHSVFGKQAMQRHLKRTGSGLASTSSLGGPVGNDVVDVQFGGRPGDNADDGKHGGGTKSTTTEDEIFICRRIPAPGPSAKNRADMLIAVTEKDARAKPIWVACAESPTHVIDMVLSIYIRRARLPEPGEIVFCTSSTRLEDIELLFWRFIQAKKHQRGNCVFCVADIHALSYTMQCAVVERLNDFLNEFGTEDAASLVFVSGKPRQVILNAFSAQTVELPPLDVKSLRDACAHAFAEHCGETLAVSSNINGGGKTHFILRWVGTRQRDGDEIAYRRVPFRESTSAAKLVNVLSSYEHVTKDYQRNAFHLDIGHIIPANANTVLFELLILGVLKNTRTCQTYHRNNRDVFLLEIPNSRGEKTSKALRFCSLLPINKIRVGPDSLDLHRPIFHNDDPTRIVAPEYSELLFVCKFLNAYEAGKFKPGDSYDLEWEPWLEQDPSPAQAFKLLCKYTAEDDAPSYNIFHSFIMFMNSGFYGVLQFPVFHPAIMSQLEGLASLKHVFTKLLIETTKDFALRAVPRGRQFGTVIRERKLSGDESDLAAAIAASVDDAGNPLVPAAAAAAANANGDLEIAVQLDNDVDSDTGSDTGSEDDVIDIPALAPPGLLRMSSRNSEYEDAVRAAEQQMPPLVRELSDDIATRFAEMTKWDDTEHPVVLFLTSLRSQEVDGLHIISLNPHFADKYFRNDMKQTLIDNSVPLDKNWTELKSEEGIEIIRRVEGFSMVSGSHQLAVPDLDQTYVVTIDNLLKMLSIQQRLKNNLPVIIMGETGCGKSSLIRQLCAIIRAPLRTLNIHGGMEDHHILEWMRYVIAEACAFPRERIVVFLDEVNTCNCMGLFKEMVCDRSMNGQLLPPNLKLIAACNPYRLKPARALQEEKMAGLIFDHHSHTLGENVGTGITDPLKDLVYRVHPLPESMIDCVFDFGALAPETEQLYIKAMLKRQLGIFVSDEDKYGKKEDEKKDKKKTGDGDENENESGDDDDEPQEVDLTAAATAAAAANQMEEDPAAQDAAMAAALQEQLNAEQNEMMALQAEMQARIMQSKKSNKLTPFGEWVAVFAELICTAQEFVRRKHGGERSVVSLRDVARCVKVYRWFAEHLVGMTDSVFTLEDFYAVRKNARPYVRQAAILSLAYCYHARLPRDDRNEFCDSLEERYKELQKPLEKKSKKSAQERDARHRNRRGYLRNRTRGGRAPPAAAGGVFGGFGYFGGDNNAAQDDHLRDSGNMWSWLDDDGPMYGPRSTWLKLDAQTFNNVLRSMQRQFVAHMNLGEGIALNEALLENLFMILVSVLNKIPIFVVGKPGSSKSLAMNLVQQNLNGDASENKFLKSLPAVEVFSYQCSPLSTSSGIMQAFESADRYTEQASNTIAVVLLDEVGLAEQSPHLPLKVLHKLLDEKGGEQAVVGISNWALDPAKMNRAVHLYRPAPTVEDLSRTAEGMVMSANLKGYLQSLARAYSEVYHAQTQDDFWGLREFYSTVRHINRSLQKYRRPLDGAIIMESVQRNFGGRPQEMGNVLKVFFTSLGIAMENIIRLGVVDLVTQNLAAKGTDARHLMLLTENNAALSLLFDNNILDHDSTNVIFGSDFPLDQTDLQVCLNIQRVKLCMAAGVTVVLVHCESLYESLYDLLNQHYTEYGQQMYVRLAFGTHSRLCPIHRDFRVVVIVEKVEAYTRLAPPLLNRFEKQVMQREHMLSDAHHQMVARLQGFANTFAANLGPARHVRAKKKRRRKKPTANANAAAAAADGKSGGGTAGDDLPVASNAEHDDFDEYETDDEDDEQSVVAASGDNGAVNDMRLRRVGLQQLRSCFVGYHSSMIASLVQSMPDDLLASDPNALFQEAVKRLLWCAVPESVCRVIGGENNRLLQEEHMVDVTDMYFKQQYHSDLPSFADNMLEQWSDDLGAQVVGMTFSPLTFNVDHLIREQTQWKDVTVSVLHELSSERDLIQQVEEFFDASNDGSVLVVQCDPLAASLRRIVHARYICEQARAKHLRTKLARKGPVREVSDGAAPSDEKNDGDVVNIHFRGDNDADADADADADDGKHADDDDGKHDGDDESKTAVVERAASDGPRGVHVVMLIHLPRGDIAYNFDFDKRWNYAFIDSTMPAHVTGLPDIQSMLGHSLEDIMGNLDMRQMLLRTFRAAMTRLVYMHERTNDDVRRQILFLLKHIEERHDDSPLVGIVKSTVREMVEQSELSLDIMATAREETELALAGTFQAALHRKLSDVVSSYFAIILSHLDRNAGMYLVDETDGNVQELWLYLYRRSFKDMQIAQRAQRTREVEVKSDGAGNQPFDCRFPFSFFLIKLLESLRPAVANLRSNQADALHQQVQLLNLEHGIGGELPESLLRRYMYDFTCMLAVHTPALDKQSQSDIVWRALTVCAPDNKTPTRLADIHARYWQIERSLPLYFELVDAVPPAKEALTKHLSQVNSMGDETNVEVVGIVLSALAPDKQGWKSVSDYSRWKAMVELSRPTINSIIGHDDMSSAETANDTLHNTRAAWEKLLFAYTFIRDVAVPLRVPPASAVNAIRALGSGNYRTRAVFHSLLRMLGDVAPVIISDGKADSDSVGTQTVEYVWRSASRQSGGRRSRAIVRRFLEYFILEFCFSPHASDKVEHDLLQEFVYLLARDEQLGGGEIPKSFYADLFPPGAGPVSLLRSLLSVPEEKSKNFVRDTVLSELTRSVQSTTFLDAPLCVAFASLHEDDICKRRITTVEQAMAAARDVQTRDLLFQAKAGGAAGGMAGPPGGAPGGPPGGAGMGASTTAASGSTGGSANEVERVLNSIATTRRVLMLFAQEICETLGGSSSDPESESESDEKSAAASSSASSSGRPKQIAPVERLRRLGAFQKATSHLLTVSSSRHADYIRSARMFLLKQLERARGVSFVRNALTQAPLRGSAWLVEWVNTGDTGLTRFLGDNKLPRNNPFVSLPMWDQVNAAITTALSPVGALESLEATIAQLSQVAPNQVKGALLASVFCECLLIQVLPQIPSVTRQKIEDVQNWVTQSPTLQAFMRPFERQLVLFFSGRVPVRAHGGHRALTLSPSSSTEQIELMRLVVHLCARVISSDVSRPQILSHFQALILSPHKMYDSWLPMQPEDATAMAVRVLGGRWYKCPNGHAYYVDQCGRPTVIQKCATCGVDIGGTDHNLLDTNQDLDDDLTGNTNYSQRTKVKDSSEANYCLRPAKEEKTLFDSVRGTAAIPCRAMRLMLHIALVSGSIAGEDTWLKLVPPLMNKTYHAECKDPASFFAAQLMEDWEAMNKMVSNKSVDDVATLLHVSLIRMGADDSKVGAIFRDQDQRSQWEKACEAHLEPLVDQTLMGERLEQASQDFKVGDDDEGNVFAAELLERFDIENMKRDMRFKTSAALWNFRKPFELADFRNAMMMDQKHNDKYPLLYGFLDKEDRFRALRHLPGAVEFVMLMHDRHNRRIDWDGARQTTIGDVLKDVPDRRRWLRAFADFKVLWDLLWNPGYVERDGCLIIPQSFIDAKLSHDTPISFCLPHEANEGICPQALLSFAGQLHNGFLEVVGQLLLLRGEELGNRGDATDSQLSSKYFTNAHALLYNFSEFSQFVEKQCVHNMRGGVEFDFASAEQFLLHNYFIGKPIINLELPMMQYSNVVGTASTDVLKQKVRQEVLPKDVCDSILRELGSMAVARSCMELLETCISFLQATGGGLVQQLDIGEISLGDYAKDVLLMKDADFGSATVGRELKLKHIVSLHSLLQDFTTFDPTALVHEKYKRELTMDEKQLASLNEQLDHLNAYMPLILSAMKSYMPALAESNTGDDQIIKDNLGYKEAEGIDGFLADESWYMDHFPAGVTMSNFVALYKHIQARPQQA